MRIATVSSLIIWAAHGHDHAQKLEARNFSSNLGDRLVVTLFDSELHAWSSQRAYLESTTLGKLRLQLDSIKVGSHSVRPRPLRISPPATPSRHTDGIVSAPTAAPPMVKRRSAILGTAGLAMAPQLHGAALADVARDCSGLRARGLQVAITGASSGIGLAGAQLLYECGANVIVLNRNDARVQESINAIKGSSASPAGVGTVEGMVCDLASLSSVKAAAEKLSKREPPLDVLCLNAGVQYTGEPTARITEDGFEQTLQTNHLGQFLLAQRLLPTLARARRQSLSKTGVDEPARIVVTASEVHDPLSPGGSVGPGASLGKLQGLTRAEAAGAGMVDGGSFDADKMYKDTKLCNLLFTYELTRRLEAAGVTPANIAVNAFGPGLITTSGFFRYQNPLFVKTFDFAAGSIFRVTESVKGGGTLLANMAANPEYFSGSSGYWNNALAGYGGHKFVSTPTSIESQDAAKASSLYDASARLVGVDADATVKAAASVLAGVGS